MTHPIRARRPAPGYSRGQQIAHRAINTSYAVGAVPNPTGKFIAPALRPEQRPDLVNTISMPRIGKRRRPVPAWIGWAAVAVGAVIALASAAVLVFAANAITGLGR